MNKKIRVRFAPSPTGALHIGGLRTALYNYLFAKKYNGDFILRIEDTDIKRNINTSINYILKTLKWCKIKYNEGFHKKGKYCPYIQSKRISIYKKYLKKLINNNFAYYSFETEQELNIYKKKYKNFIYNALTRNKLKNSLTLNSTLTNKYIKNKKYVIRLKTPKNTNIIFNDKVYGKITINTNEINDKILFRSDLTPTYHLASVIDDHIMKISHIIRGKEWISSTPIHILIYNYFNWNLPNFVHLPLILNDLGGKISKRLNYNDSVPIYPINSKHFNIKNSYKKKGFLPNALINIIALLGWAPNYNKEIYSLNQIIELFDFNNISKKDVHLNYKKFCWINKQYINNSNSHFIDNILLKFLKKKIKNKKIKTIYLKKIIKLTKNRIFLINDIWNVSYYFFINPIKFNIPNSIYLLIKKNYKKILFFFKKIILFFKKKKKKKEIEIFLNKISNIFYLKLLRISLVGKLIGINMLYILSLINNKIIINRINYFLKQIIIK
ncbi:MAG: glutamate--tRNA ligase [Candidatus Shikimatogenerans bostrichidophilus]|nr:MAG: glutamate--tRNA ligase [Candidatus Shikimatogenerans bostrichidophilus]